jgi:hypothetical protein
MAPAPSDSGGRPWARTRDEDLETACPPRLRGFRSDQPGHDVGRDPFPNEAQQPPDFGRLDPHLLPGPSPQGIAEGRKRRVLCQRPSSRRRVRGVAPLVAESPDPARRKHDFQPRRRCLEPSESPANQTDPVSTMRRVRAANSVLSWLIRAIVARGLPRQRRSASPTRPPRDRCVVGARSLHTCWGLTTRGTSPALRTAREAIQGDVLPYRGVSERHARTPAMLRGTVSFCKSAWIQS